MITFKDLDLTVIGEPLQDWLNANHSDDTDLYWKGGLWEQALFVRDDLHRLLTPPGLSYEERKSRSVRVVSTHRSKSVLLPVYEIRTPAFDDGALNAPGLCARLRLRYNFFNWVVSVEAPLSVRDNFKDLFNRENTVNPIYAEGFKNEWVFGPYADDRQRFTLQLHGRFELWTFAWLLRAP